MRRVFIDRYGVWRFGWVITAFLAVAVAVVGLLILGIVEVSRAYDRRVCSKYEQVLEQPTEFVTYTRWSWDCLTEVGGRMVKAEDYLRLQNLKLNEEK